HLLVFTCALGGRLAHGQAMSAADFWDISQGAVITASSGVMDAAGSPAGLFGQNGQDNADGSTWTYFVDGQPPGYVHFVEWETPGDVTLGEVRVFALGDGEQFNN